MKELRRRARRAIAKRNAQRIAVYKEKLSENLPCQIDLWRKRESRLLDLITGKAGVSIAALLVRQCPDLPKEIDPDTDEESKHEDKEKENAGNFKKHEDSKVQETDPTIRAWTERDVSSHQALDISEKQRVRLQQQAMAMVQYCSEMRSRALAMVKFIKKECPEGRGDVMTLFRNKYPHYGLRWITRDVCEKLRKLFACLLACLPSPHSTTHPLDIKDVDTFTRWRKYYFKSGCFRPDRRGRFTAGFLLRHEDLKQTLTQWLLARSKRDINISDVSRYTYNSHAPTHALINTQSPTHRRAIT